MNVGRSSRVIGQSPSFQLSIFINLRQSHTHSNADRSKDKHSMLCCCRKPQHSKSMLCLGLHWKQATRGKQAAWVCFWLCLGLLWYALLCVWLHPKSVFQKTPHWTVFKRNERVSSHPVPVCANLTHRHHVYFCVGLKHHRHLCGHAPRSAAMPSWRKT